MKIFTVYINGIEYGSFKRRVWAEEMINKLTQEDIILGLRSPLYYIEEV